MTPSAPRAAAGARGDGDAGPSRAAAAPPGGRQRTSTMTPTGPPGGGGGARPAKSGPALINRTFSAQEILHLPFDLSPTFTKMELLDYLNKFKIEDFAAGCFRKHRAGSKLSKKMIPIETITSFTSVPLKKPLLPEIPKNLKKVGAGVFDLILQYTGVKPGHGQLQAARQILQILKEKPIFVDECFFQLVKQTINNRNSAFLLKTWELFLVVATVYPVSNDRYKWILAHLARNTADPDQRIAHVATFIFLRLETRHYLGRPLDYSGDRAYIERIPEHIARPAGYFGVLLYELMWCQRAAYPRLPIPYVLHYMVGLLKERNALRTEGIFRAPGTEGVIREILFTVDGDVTAIARGDVNVIANLLKTWLKELPNPLVPVELVPLFQTMCDQNKYLGFVEKLPQVHQLTLIYLIGFLQEVCHNTEYTGMEKADLAMIFGPCILNPARVAGNDPEKVQRLTGLSVAFCSRLIEARDPAVIYPLHPAYLPKPAVPQKPKAGPPQPPGPAPADQQYEQGYAQGQYQDDGEGEGDPDQQYPPQ